MELSLRFVVGLLGVVVVIGTVRSAVRALRGRLDEDATRAERWFIELAGCAAVLTVFSLVIVAGMIFLAGATIDEFRPFMIVGFAAAGLYGVFGAIGGFMSGLRSGRKSRG